MSNLFQQLGFSLVDYSFAFFFNVFHSLYSFPLRLVSLPFRFFFGMIGFFGSIFFKVSPWKDMSSLTSYLQSTIFWPLGWMMKMFLLSEVPEEKIDQALEINKLEHQRLQEIKETNRVEAAPIVSHVKDAESAAQKSSESSKETILQSKVVQYEKLDENAQSQIKHLQDLISLRDRQNEDLDREVKQIKKWSELLEDRKHQLEDFNEKLINRNRSYEEKFRLMQENLQERLNTLKKDYSSLEAEMQRLEKNHENEKQQIFLKWKADVNEFENVLKTERIDKKRLEKAIEGIKTGLSQRYLLNKTLEQEVVHQEQKIEQLKIDYESYKDEANKKLEQDKQKIANVNHLRKEKKRLSKEVRNLKRDMKKHDNVLSAVANQKQTEVDLLKSNQEKMSQILHVVAEDNLHLQEENEELAEENFFQGALLELEEEKLEEQEKVLEEKEETMESMRKQKPIKKKKKVTLKETTTTIVEEGKKPEVPPASAPAQEHLPKEEKKENSTPPSSYLEAATRGMEQGDVSAEKKQQSESNVDANADVITTTDVPLPIPPKKEQDQSNPEASEASSYSQAVYGLKDEGSSSNVAEKHNEGESRSSPRPTQRISS